MNPDFVVPPLTARDREDLRSRGVSLKNIARQALLLQKPASRIPVLRPCSVGDGIERPPHSQRTLLARLGDRAVLEGRVSRFVPASGAATRLFTALLQLDRFRKATGRKTETLLRSDQYPFARESARFFSHIRSLALYEPLRECLAARHRDIVGLLTSHDLDPLLDALFDSAGLDMARRPKALMPFHRTGQLIRTAFEEQVREAVAFSRRAGLVQAHFTVSAEFLSEFKRLGNALTRHLARRFGVRVRLGFSVQDPSTDTLAFDEGKTWVRHADGSLLFRPGGHGALLGNLEGTGGDIVLIKNIDNIPRSSQQAEGNRWRKMLVGRLITAQAEANGWINVLLTKNPSAEMIQRAEAFVFRTLGIKIKGKVHAHKILDRPWRVCGMVRNTGEPGGGPFWVKGTEGVSRQILEGSQLGKSQKKFGVRSTHFNPVDMVVGLKDGRGRPFDLSRFVDLSQGMISTKHFEGREILTWEHPGLWNGAMAHWNTIFVEVPSDIFHPVKTITDLLRSGHTV